MPNHETPDDEQFGPADHLCGTLRKRQHAGAKKEDVPKYLEMLTKSKSGDERALAADMLGRRGAINVKDVADALEPLRMALKSDPDLKVRRASAKSLGMIAPEPASDTVPLLIDTLADKDYGLRMTAVQALAGYGPEARDALPALRTLQKQTKDKKDMKTARGHHHAHQRKKEEKVTYSSAAASASLVACRSGPRKTIRPLEVSYAEIATVTTSPGKMRIKCLRILPAMWQMISCPLSSLTRNCVFANACMTFPWNWIASSFAINTPEKTWDESM